MESIAVQDSKPSSSGWADEHVKSWDDLTKVLHSATLLPLKKEQGGHRRSSFVFRGMSNASWPLKTSLERLGSPPEKVEDAALRAGTEDFFGVEAVLFGETPRTGAVRGRTAP